MLSPGNPGKLTFTGFALVALAHMLQHILHRLTVGKYTRRLAGPGIPGPRSDRPALLAPLALVGVEQ